LPDQLDSALRIDPSVPHISWLVHSLLLLTIMCAGMTCIVKLCGLQPINGAEVVFMLLFAYGLSLTAFRYEPST